MNRAQQIHMGLGNGVFFGIGAHRESGMFTKHGLQTRCVPGRNYSFLPLAEMLTWGHQHCSHMQQRFGPDTQSSDVEIEISHSEGPKWPQRSAGSPRVRPVVSHGERCRPELTSAAACASEALCAKKGARHLCPPPTPRAHTRQVQAEGHVPPSGGRISGMQSAFTDRCPGVGVGLPNTG